MAAKSKADRITVRLYINKGSLLHPLLSALTTEQARRDAVIGLATPQLFRQVQPLLIDKKGS